MDRVGLPCQPLSIGSPFTTQYGESGVAYSTADLRERIAGSGLTLGRVTGRTVIDLGRRFTVRQPDVRVVRPRDLLVLEFRFVNLERSGARLVRADPARPAYLIAAHQPQSFGEEAFPEIGDQSTYSQDGNLSGRDPPKTAPGASSPIAEQAQIRIAGESRTVHEMPAGVDGLDWSLGAFLDALRQWPLFLDGNAQPDPGDFRWEAAVKIGWLTRDLRHIAMMARDALGESADRGALDRLAAELSRTSLAAARRGGDVDATALRRRLDSTIRRAVPGGDRETARVDQVAAAIYVRAQAGRRALVDVSRGRVRDIFVLDRLPPDIFAEFLRPDPPSEHETALEMPYRLIASPLKTAGFVHALEPVTRGDRTELWHSRMGTRRLTLDGVEVDDRAGRPTDGGGWDGEKLRFIWSPDYPDRTAGEFLKSLDRLDRRMLVKLTAGFNEKKQDGRSKFTPRAVYVRRLMLTALGGDLEAHRKFDPRPEQVDLSAWSHKAAIGRDYFTRVEYSGFLFPFGHRATLVKITERKFGWRNEAAKTDRVAALRQRYFIIVRDRVIDYPGAAPQPHQGRSLPFESVICTTEVTPDLARPGLGELNRVRTVTGDTDETLWRMAFWPRLADRDYAFSLVGVDHKGRKISFEMPLLFISELKNISGDIGKIAQHWNQEQEPSRGRRTPRFDGQTVRMAEPAGDAKDVDVPLQSVEFLAVAPTSGTRPTPQPKLQQYPRFGKSVARLAAAERLTGVERDETIRFYTPYLDNGLQGGMVFAEIANAAKLAFGSQAPSDKVGGVATPDLTPSGLSALHGIASGALDIYNGGQFDPAAFFPDAKLLGFFSLKDLLKALPLGNSGDTPKFVTAELPDRIQTKFAIRQELDDGEALPGLILGAGGKTVFKLDTLVDAPLDGTAPTTSITGELTHFKLSFLGALIVHFDRLRFFVQPGQKPDVDVDLNPTTGVMFGGPLEFVNRLRDFIPANGFSDPPQLDITPAGLTAGYTLGLPPVQVGILALSNISLGASFSLPFTGGPPTARFNFAERQNTFNLTVAMFGGGGFFALVAAADGIKEVEAQLEFGAQIAINLGVASGSVYVKGGFYFHYATDKVKFEGFVEMGGRLSVLGLISVSLTFHLSLAYELLQKSANNGIRASKLFGQATLTVEIEILFFSASVDVTVEKTFVGSEADPKFIDLVPQKALWDEYCAAYA